MITSHKQLSSGNFLVIRTETGKDISCETSKPASKEDKAEASAVIETVLEAVGYKGKPNIEFSVKKGKANV